MIYGLKELFSFVFDFVPYIFLISSFIAAVDTYKKWKNGDFKVSSNN